MRILILAFKDLTQICATRNPCCSVVMPVVISFHGPGLPGGEKILHKIHAYRSPGWERIQAVKWVKGSTSAWKIRYGKAYPHEKDAALETLQNGDVAEALVIPSGFDEQAEQSPVKQIVHSADATSTKAVTLFRCCQRARYPS